MQTSRSICECWGDRITRVVVLRVLCGAWLVPAASLMWIGLATTGVRHISDASLARALGRTQAVAVLLMVFTVLLGASAIVRLLPVSSRPEPADRPGPAELDGFDEPRPLGPGSGWYGPHLIALAVAVVLGSAGALVGSLASLLWPLAALCGFGGALALPRALLRMPGPWNGPVAALTVGMMFQLTVGWLHVVHPIGVASPGLIIEGLILAWAAASAARIDLFAPQPAPLDAESVPELVTSPAAFSPRSVPPSFAEPMVGH